VWCQFHAFACCYKVVMYICSSWSIWLRNSSLVWICSVWSVTRCEGNIFIFKTLLKLIYLLLATGWHINTDFGFLAQAVAVRELAHAFVTTMQRSADRAEVIPTVHGSTVVPVQPHCVSGCLHSTNAAATVSSMPSCFMEPLDTRAGNDWTSLNG